MNRRRLLKLAAAAGYPLASFALHSPALASPRSWRQKRTLATGLSSPVGMAIDSTGAVLVANWSAGTIVSIDHDGKTTSLAAGLSGPSGLAISSQDDIFIASYHQDLVWRMPPQTAANRRYSSQAWQHRQGCHSTTTATC